MRRRDNNGLRGENTANHTWDAHLHGIGGVPVHGDRLRAVAHSRQQNRLQAHEEHQSHERRGNHGNNVDDDQHRHHRHPDSTSDNTDANRTFAPADLAAVVHNHLLLLPPPSSHLHHIHTPLWPCIRRVAGILRHFSSYPPCSPSYRATFCHSHGVIADLRDLEETMLADDLRRRSFGDFSRSSTVSPSRKKITRASPARNFRHKLSLSVKHRLRASPSRNDQIRFASLGASFSMVSEVAAPVPWIQPVFISLRAQLARLLIGSRFRRIFSKIMPTLRFSPTPRTQRVVSRGSPPSERGSQPSVGVEIT